MKSGYLGSLGKTLKCICRFCTKLCHLHKEEDCEWRAHLNHAEFIPMQHCRAQGVLGQCSGAHEWSWGYPEQDQEQNSAILVDPSQLRLFCDSTLLDPILQENIQIFHIPNFLLSTWAAQRCVHSPGPAPAPWHQVGPVPRGSKRSQLNTEYSAAPQTCPEPLKPSSACTYPECWDEFQWHPDREEFLMALPGLLSAATLLSLWGEQFNKAATNKLHNIARPLFCKSRSRGK